MTEWLFRLCVFAGGWALGLIWGAGLYAIWVSHQAAPREAVHAARLRVAINLAGWCFIGWLFWRGWPR